MTPLLAQTALALLLGFVLGLFHFATLSRVTALYLDGSPARAVALQLVRLAALAGLLIALATQGAVGLIAGACGLIAGRGIVLRRVRKAP